MGSPLRFGRAHAHLLAKSRSTPEMVDRMICDHQASQPTPHSRALSRVSATVCEVHIATGAARGRAAESGVCATAPCGSAARGALRHWTAANRGAVPTCRASVECGASAAQTSVA
eukprot:5622393-Prymnesium_polylepis.1